MKKYLSLLIIILGLSVSAYSQNAECPSGYICLTQADGTRVMQALGELKAQRELAQAQDEKAEILKSQIETLKALVEEQKRTIQAQEQVITKLNELKCSKTKFFWGVVSVKRCG